jgi:hypothetical protein
MIAGSSRVLGKYAGQPSHHIVATLPQPLQENFRVSFFGCECNLQGEPMSLRILGSLLLLTLFAALRLPITSAGSQDAETPHNGPKEGPWNGPKWEYNAVRLGPPNCTNEALLNSTLNAWGLKGWELVTYEPLTPPFTNADGNILMRPAATGAGREVSPQLADSFQGTINMKMAQSDRSYCRVLFKRLKPI